MISMERVTSRVDRYSLYHVTYTIGAPGEGVLRSHNLVGRPFLAGGKGEGLGTRLGLDGRRSGLERRGVSLLV